MNTKYVIFIPPNGEFKKQDFSLQRIAQWLKTRKQIETTLLYIKSKNEDKLIDIFDNIIEVSNKEEILTKLKMLSCDIIFNRGWMHSYTFSKELVKQFDNVVINIKDWNFSSKDEYEFLFNDTKDFEAIEYIFQNSKYILSHFTQEQADIWSKEYDVDKKKFIFFPEYCNEEKFIDKDITYEDIKLVYAGKIHKSNLPEQLFPAKSHLRSIMKITNKNIGIDFVLPEREYENVLLNRDDFLDFLYENKFNKNFNLLKGKALSSSILKKYHFGFFELETSGKNKSLYRYAVTSKFAFYLESATPMLVNEDFISMSNLVSQHKLGIVFNNKDLNTIDKLLDISSEEYCEYVNNIKKFRNSFTYDESTNLVKEILKYE